MPGSNMLEKRNIRLMITLMLLTGITGIVYWMELNKGTVAVDKNIFKVEDSKSIDKVLLESPAGKVELKFNGSRWKVNERFETDRNLIDVLFATIQEAEPKRPVAESLKDSLILVIKQEGVKVSLLSEDKVMKSFYAGGNASKTQAYFLKEGDESPYLMTIPGYRVYVSGVFELPESGWRDKRIFNFNWKNFKSLTASFPFNPKQNFKVSFLNQYFGIEGVADADTTKLNDYLDAVSLLSVDQFIAKGQSIRYDSLLSTSPTIILEVQDVANRRYRLSLFAPLKSEPTIVGRFGESEGMVFQRQYLSRIMKGRDYFVKP